MTEESITQEVVVKETNPKPKAPILPSPYWTGILAIVLVLIVYVINVGLPWKGYDINSINGVSLLDAAAITAMAFYFSAQTIMKRLVAYITFDPVTDVRGILAIVNVVGFALAIILSTSAKVPINFDTISPLFLMAIAWYFKDNTL